MGLRLLTLPVVIDPFLAPFACCTVERVRDNVIGVNPPKLGRLATLGGFANSHSHLSRARVNDNNVISLCPTDVVRLIAREYTYGLAFPFGSRSRVSFMKENFSLACRTKMPTALEELIMLEEFCFSAPPPMARIYLLQLPNELLDMICSYIGLRDYVCVRQGCKRLHILNDLPILRYPAYAASTVSFDGSAILTSHLRMKLELDDLNDESFNFIVQEGHIAEVRRLLACHKAHNVTAAARQSSFHTILLSHEFDSTTEKQNCIEVLLVLLRDGCVDPNTEYR